MLTRIPKKRQALLIALGLVAFLSYEWSALVPKANAIPAFARKYNFACNVCHVPSFPKLNDFGNLFRDHGFQLGGDQDLPTYEGTTMGYWPVSLRTILGYQTASLRADGSGISSGSFGFNFINLLAYGTITRNVAFRINYSPGLASSGFYTSPSASSGDLNFANVRLSNLERFLGVTDKNSYLLNLTVGKYELDLPFSEFRSPTVNTPMAIYTYTSGTPYTTALGGPLNNVRSYANPNNFSLQNPQPGIELFGIKPTGGNGYLRYSLNAISNSNLNNGTGGVGGGKGLNFYGHVTQSFGGYGIVTGHRIGVFGMYGEAPTTANSVCPTCTAVGGGGQPFSRIGVDVSTTFDGQWNLFGAILHAYDSKELFASKGIANAQNAAWNGGFVELDWYPTQLPYFGTPGWLFIYRYDLIRNEKQGNPTFANSYNDVDSHTWMGRYYFHLSARTDIAWHTELNSFRAQGAGNRGGDQVGQSVFTGFDFAF